MLPLDHRMMYLQHRVYLYTNKNSGFVAHNNSTIQYLASAAFLIDVPFDFLPMTKH